MTLGDEDLAAQHLRVSRKWIDNFANWNNRGGFFTSLVVCKPSDHLFLGDLTLDIEHLAELIRLLQAFPVVFQISEALLLASKLEHRPAIEPNASGITD